MPLKLTLRSKQNKQTLMYKSIEMATHGHVKKQDITNLLSSVLYENIIMRKNHRFRTWNIQIRSYFIHSSIQFTKNINIHVVICKPVTGKLRGSLYNITISRVIPNNLYKCYIRLAYISSCLRFHQNACNWIM